MDSFAKKGLVGLSEKRDQGIAFLKEPPRPVEGEGLWSNGGKPKGFKAWTEKEE